MSKQICVKELHKKVTFHDIRKGYFPHVMLARSKANEEPVYYNESGETTHRQSAIDNEPSANVYEFDENETATASNQRPQSGYEEIEMDSGSAIHAQQSQNLNNSLDYDDITFVGQEKDGLLDGDNETYSTGHSQVNDHRKAILGGNDDEHANIADTDLAGNASVASKYQHRSSSTNETSNRTGTQ